MQVHASSFLPSYSSPLSVMTGECGLDAVLLLELFLEVEPFLEPGGRPFFRLPVSPSMVGSPATLSSDSFGLSFSSMLVCVEDSTYFRFGVDSHWLNYFWWPGVSCDVPPTTRYTAKQYSQYLSLGQDEVMFQFQFYLIILWGVDCQLTRVNLLVIRGGLRCAAYLPVHLQSNPVRRTITHPTVMGSTKNSGAASF